MLSCWLRKHLLTVPVQWDPPVACPRPQAYWLWDQRKLAGICQACSAIRMNDAQGSEQCLPLVG